MTIAQLDVRLRQAWDDLSRPLADVLRERVADYLPDAEIRVVLRRSGPLDACDLLRIWQAVDKLDGLPHVLGPLVTTGEYQEF